jgi:hypothetical protein
MAGNRSAEPQSAAVRTAASWVLEGRNGGKDLASWLRLSLLREGGRMGAFIS